MISNRVKKRVDRILAGLVSVAMTLTMVPEIWLPIHAEIVGKEIANAEISTDATSGVTTASAPDGYVPISSDDISLFSLQNNSKSQVLLIEDTYPWRSNANSIVLDSIGAAYKKVKTSDFLYQDLGNYSVIVFANDQQFSTYNNYSSFKESIESFAQLGGVVVFGACDAGWADGRLSTELPGGVTKHLDYDYNNYIIDYDHPIVTAELSDGNSLSDDLLYSNYCSHDYFDEETLPKGSNVIIRGSKSNAPTLVEYPCGKGRIIASGLTWEHNFNTYDRFAKRVMDDLFLYALSIANIDVNMQPPIAVSVDAPQQLTSNGNGYSPNPFSVDALLKNVSDESVKDIKVRIVLPEGLQLTDSDTEIVEIGTMDPENEKNILWQVKAKSINSAKRYSYKVIVTAENGYEKIVEKTVYVPMISQNNDYAIFSGSNTNPLSLYGWKSNFTGNIYTGNSFNYGGSELYINGKVDAVETVTVNGWKTEITETNEGVSSIAMPDYDGVINENAQPYEYFEESPAYIEDKTVVNSSIKVNGDVTISGTTFEGDCYIIAEGNITYNVESFNTTGRVFLYSKKGNITINGSQININGAMYAPKGNVTFNTYDTTVKGFICADSISFNGSIFNVSGANFDMVQSRSKGIVKTYTTDADFNEGTLNGVSLAVPEQLILADKAAGEATANEKIFGDTESGKGVKVRYFSDKTFLSEKDTEINIGYDLSGFGDADINENAVDLILVVDESGSMGGSRLTNTKAAAKEIIAQMKDNDRCAVLGFTFSLDKKQELTSDKNLLNKAVDRLYANGGTYIYKGINGALDMFGSMSSDSRQKYIILLSDGEDGASAASLNAAKSAGEKGIRIFAMMIGTGTLQMQNIAIHSNGIYKNAPTSADIGKIMSYFASEVFNVAGRNSTFRTTIKDKNSVDILSISPAPSEVTENADGSVTLEWNFDRITIDEAKRISIPLSVNAKDGFAELTENTSCVYYDREGKPHIIYADDVTVPVSRYSDSGNWSVVFDSEKDDINWSHIYWKGKRYGDGKITVYASASVDGISFGEAVPVNNYEKLTGLVGRYVKLNVDMTVSSDGRSPELFDITVMSDKAKAPEFSNAEPTAQIVCKDTVKVNNPLNIRADISDDCLKSDIAVEWSCTEDGVTLGDSTAFLTNAVFTKTGSYEIVCTVNDGEKTVAAVKNITVEPADSYADIDPDRQESPAPQIAVELPEYAYRKQVINAKIENLNDTEISWYSVIFNGNTAITVDDDGNFTLTMPNSNAKYPVIVRAFDWAGRSDVKEFVITVDGIIPSVSVTASSEKVVVGGEASYTVSLSNKSRIASIKYTLNGEEVSLTADGKYVLDTSAAGEYEFTAEVTDCTGRKFTSSAKITVEEPIAADEEAPTVDISFDKEEYSKGDTVKAQITAADNVGVAKTEAFVNGNKAEIDENNCVTIENAAVGEYVFTANAYDEAGNKGTVTKTIIVASADEEAPTVTISLEKDTYFENDDIIFTVTAEDNVAVTKLEVTVDGSVITVDENGRYTIKNAELKTYEITAKAYDEAGNEGTAKESVAVNEFVAPDTEAPVVSIKFDKDTYLERDDIVFTVTAEDDTAVTKIEVTVDGKAVELDGNGSYTIKNAEQKTYTVTAKAYDEAGNIGEASANVPVNEASAPVISAVFDKESYSEGDSLTVLVTAEGQREIKEIKAFVNGEEKALDENGTLVIDKLSQGEYVFRFTAEDIKGFSSECEKTVVVLPIDTEDRRLTAEIEPFVEYGESALLTVKITDEISPETLKVTLDGKDISLSDELTYQFKAEELFEHSFVISAKTNGGEVLEKEVTIFVMDSVCPTMTITYDKPDGYYEGDDIIATIVAEDNVGIKRVEYTYDGIEYPIDKDGKVIIPKIHVDNHVVVANAWDTFGNCITLTSAFIIAYDETTGETIITNEDEVENEELVCKLYSPKDGQSVTAPISVVGTAAGTKFKSYKLEYAPVGSKNYTLIREGTEAVNANLLGKLDTTMLNNGLYNIRLTVYSDTKNISIENVISVEGNMKIGNFSLSFQDMDFNVSGLPLTVIRTYDSRNRGTNGDFGYGWNMSTAGLTLTESCNMSRYWKYTSSTGSLGNVNYDIKGTRAHIVTVNYGNGKTDKFTMTVKNAYQYYSPDYGVNVSFKAENGSKSKLEIVGMDELALNSGMLLDRYDFSEFVYTKYRLTTQDGTVYIIHKTNGVESVTEPNGSKITFSAKGITHSDGKSIVFDRDDKGRIKSIVSPTDKKVTYTYDENGDLASVTDVSGEVTQFIYEDHYLTDIIDPRGVKVSRNIYDDSGRLIKTIDADGNEIKYDHDVDGREERITDRNGNVTRYIYDQYGNILKQTDPMGNTVRNTYDKNGNPATKTDAMGNVTTYSYDSTGNMLTMTDAEGHTVTNEYNSKGQLTSIDAMGITAMTVAYDSKGNTTSTTDAMGNSIDYSYDTKGRLTSVADEIGSYMNMTYDSNGNVISATNGAGTTAQFTYDADGNCTAKTLTYTSDGAQKTVTEQYFYDNSGNLVKIIDSDGNVTTTEYNSMGKVSSATDEKGRKTSYDYDNFGNLVKISYPDGTTETFTYDREGNNLTATDRLGRTVTMTYDKVGNLLSKTYPNGAAVTYTYDSNYNLVSETSASGGTTYYEYDKIGRNTAITDALGNKTEFSYNSKSQLESMTDAKGNVYTYSYDDNGNRIKTTYPDGSSVSSTYDARGRVTSQTDQHGYKTKYAYDGGDRLTGVTDVLGNTTKYTYDEVGNLTSVTDANGNVTRYTYDDFGRVIKTTNALGNTSEVTYDESGNVLTSTDFGGNLTTYTYDNLDRVSSKTTPDGTVSYTYTADGKLSTVTDSTGTTSFTYNSMDGLTRVDYPDGNYVSYKYDKSNRLTKVSTAFGDTAYQYDALDRITRVVDRNGYATVYEYDANGNRTAVKYANGLTVSYEYDKLNRLICEETVDSDSNIVVKYIYTLGASGERIKVEELDRTVEYTYDELYRLTSETITKGKKVTTYTYAYDSVSNRTLKTVNGVETVYTYNALNQLISENDTTYEYDNAGNLVRVVGAGKTALYVYNADNKLVKATVQQGNNVVVETYTYDYAGNRTSKTTSINNHVEKVYYLNDNSSLTNVLAELNVDGEVKVYYTIGADLVSQEVNSNVYTYLYDGHGTVRALANENGKITDTYTYDAFGNLISSTGSTANSYRYCGEQFDSTTGLYYLHARYMDTSTGRFISQDSYAGSISDPISLHKYLYANSNPVSNSDPSGYSAENDLEFYKQAWLTIDEAIKYEQRLICSSCNELAYNDQVLKIGLEIIEQLRNTGIEMAVTALLSPYVGPEFAKLIAQGVVSIFDISKKQRENKLDKTFDAFLDKDGNLLIGNYKDVKGHHVFSKAGFRDAVNYSDKTGFCISNKFMEAMGWKHEEMSKMQRKLFDYLYETGKENTLLEHIDVAYKSLIAGGASETDAAIVTTMALVDLISKGVISPTRIPWH